MALFYLDENVRELLVFLLMRLGHDVLSTSGLRRKRTPDQQQLLYAAQHDRVFVTCDADHFKLRHSAWLDWSAAWSVPSQVARHAGILIIQQDGLNRTTEDLARLIDRHVRDNLLVNRSFSWTERYGWREVV